MDVKQTEVDGHLALAKGFLSTVSLDSEANEYAIRNALSRSYYALFHICNAWLAKQPRLVPRDRRKNHDKLQKEIGRFRGMASQVRLKDFYKLREDADYRPEMLGRHKYSGDIDLFRDSAIEDVDKMRNEFRRYLIDLEGDIAHEEGGLDGHDHR